MFDKENHPLNNLKFLDEKSLWKKGEIKITDDRLEICGHPVMERWEDSYMKRLAEIATSKNGKILEVGFGLGISASYIQQQDIIEHHIIEANESVFERLLDFSKSAKHQVYPYIGFWEEITPKFPDNYFDGILFDTYPVTISELHTARFSFFNEAYRLLKQGGIFTHYSGELEFTEEYIQNLTDSGFEHYSGELVPVSPPSDCLYWNEKYIMAPSLWKL
jgi:guanidinoacetate N-methyltransferase